MTDECLSREWLVDRERDALKNELRVEVKSGKDSHPYLNLNLDHEFHDREDLPYDPSAGELTSQCFCSELVNVPPRGGDFLHE